MDINSVTTPILNALEDPEISAEPPLQKPILSGDINASNDIQKDDDLVVEEPKKHMQDSTENVNGQNDVSLGKNEKVDNEELPVKIESMEFQNRGVNRYCSNKSSYFEESENNTTSLESTTPVKSTSFGKKFIGPVGFKIDILDDGSGLPILRITDDTDEQSDTNDGHVIVEEPDDYETNDNENVQKNNSIEEIGSSDILPSPSDMNEYIDELYNPITEIEEDEYSKPEEENKNYSVSDYSLTEYTSSANTKPNKLLTNLEANGLQIHPVRGDGACLFRAISYIAFGTENEHYFIRQRAMDFIDMNRKYFQLFIDEENFDDYITRKRLATTFGNHPEIQAISEIFYKSIIIISDNDRAPIMVQGEKTIGRPFRLLYDGVHFDAIVGIDESPEFASKLNNIKKPRISYVGSFCHSPRFNRTLSIEASELSDNRNNVEGTNNNKNEASAITDAKESGDNLSGPVCRYCRNSQRRCSRHRQDN